MDSHYHQNGSTANHHHQYSALPGIAPHQLQQNGHTLPPLQAQHHNMPMQQHSIYGPPSNTPHSSAPNTPGSAGQGYQMQHAMQNHPYQHRQSYTTSIPQNTASMSQNMSALGHGRPPPVPLRPMPLGGLQHSSLPPYNSSQMLSQNSMLPVEETPTHVVGSQGRRGILPSAPGKPSINTTGGAKTTMIPAKDADGKFPCPHCTKTYLHAKHLKRHLLRHTGDRPYMCVLCRDTFSRSDILKRHFQKCSIRRGNPTGASHLSHAQAHLKKSHPGPHKTAAFSSNNESHMSNMNGMNNMSNAAGPFGISADGRIPDAVSNLTDEQAAEQARSGSLKRLSNGGGRDRRSMTGPGPGGINRSNYDQNYDQQGYKMEIPSTMPPTLNPQLGAYSMPNGHGNAPYGQHFEYGSNGANGHAAHQQGNENMPNMNSNRSGMPMYGGGPNAPPPSNVDWAHMFQPGAQDGFMNSYNSNLGQSQVSIKTEPSLAQANDGLNFPGYPAASENINTIGGSFPNWSLTSQQDPLQHTAMQITTFCFPPGSQETSRNAELRGFLSADNIKHFLEQYTHFQAHFPIIHAPTFRIADTYEGLLLGMICIGAVYSDRANPAQVRDLMDLTKVVVEKDSSIWATMSRELNGGGNSENVTVGNSKSDFEEIHAVMLVVFLSTWHGSPRQRENARRSFPVIVALARRAGMMQPSTSTNTFSVLHQPNVNAEHFGSVSFDWNAWIEQEKISRLLYTIFLYDSTQVFYFNKPPLIEHLEIRLPLPADDAAWDATTSAQCADALGLNGPAAARQRNPEGTRRPKQPEMHSALKALMHNVYDLQPGTTNTYSKFILIHALHVQIWSIQKHISQEPGVVNNSQAFPTSGANTPLMQHDWVNRGVGNGSNGSASNSTSGRATPDTSEGSLSHQHLKATNHALDKWKKAWDEDMLTQYPPSSNSLHRFGFCRDGVHFFWLAKYLLKNGRALDWQMPPDQRFTQVINILKMVKSWVVSDTSKRGEELGSVADIDKEYGKDYGVSNLTLDMAQLFRPMNKQDSPVPGVHTNISTPTSGGMM